MHRLSPPPDRPSPRRRWAAVALVALFVVALALLWPPRERPLTEGERALVGAWRYRWDAHPGDLGLEYEFRADRTCVVRRFDPQAGALRGEDAAATWRRSGDVLVVRHPGRRVLGPAPYDEEACTLTPDGPDRFRYVGVVGANSPSPGPPVTGTMTRVHRDE